MGRALLVSRCVRFAGVARIVACMIVAPSSFAIAGPTDTLWVGYSTTAHSAANPHSIGPGPGHPVAGADGYWGWDNFVPGFPDSLMGWWPIRLPYAFTGGRTLTDDQRPWMAHYYGDGLSVHTLPGGRIRGLEGVWHVDGGNTVPGPTPATTPNWVPISGAGSAWCGLRAHGDLSYIDSQTGTPYNQDALDFTYVTSGGATTKLFPGYPPQSRQFLYRDFVFQGNEHYTIEFDIRPDLAGRSDPDPTTKTGFFEKPSDCVTCDPGNFISASASAGVVDSVLIALVPTATMSLVRAAVIFCRTYPWRCAWRSLGDFYLLREVFNDMKKLWAKAKPSNEQLNTYRITLPVYTDWIPPAQERPFSVVLIQRSLQPPQPLRMVGPTLSPGGKGVQAFIDSDRRRGLPGRQNHPLPSFSRSEPSMDTEMPVAPQGGVIDNFMITKSGITQLSSGFDSPSEIDNTPEPGDVAFNSWKTLSIPMSRTFHPHDASELIYSDLCGPVDSPVRKCKLGGIVISAGDHDHNEALGGPIGSSEQERFDGVISPTINLATSGIEPNGHGIDEPHANGDILLKYDLYAGALDCFTTGTTWTIGVQSYPAQMANGGMCWGDITIPEYQSFWADPSCRTQAHSLYDLNLIHTSNPSGRPDSIRVFIGRIQQCYRFGATTGCGAADGLYFDNVSVGFVPAEPAVAPVTVESWEWIQDAFPHNNASGLPGTAAFDTCAALIRSGLNLALSTGNSLRPTIAGDTTVVRAPGEDTRVDLVFRILPGPGNYVSAGARSSGLRRVPTSPTPISVGDLSFWSEYLTNPGAFATPGAAALDAAYPGGWNPDVWRSARCDTAETNLFPVFGASPVTGRWATMYHESDPKWSTLGIPKHRCFLADTTGPANTSNITCSSVPAWLTSSSGTGYPGDPMTREHTKVIPDGLLTPGSHVEYFFRRSSVTDPSAFSMTPDTNRISPQTGDGSTDAHRWQQFGVLPDRWKAAVYGGLGSACMLFVDLADGHGVERAWVGIADSIGATSAARRGAHNGWQAGGDVDYEGKTLAELPAEIAVAAHGGQPGTTWDMYAVRAGDAPITRSAGIGSRLATAATGFATGKDTRVGPTLEMLQAYYRVLMLPSGDLQLRILGPFHENSQNDVGILEGFAFSSTVESPRAVWAMGQDFAQSEAETHPGFVPGVFGAELRDPNYSSVSGNYEEHTILRTNPGLHGGQHQLLGLGNPCDVTADVLEPASGIPEATVDVTYANVGSAAPYAASIYVPASTLRPWISLIEGWDTRRLGSAFLGTGRGRLAYFAATVSDLFGSVCSLTGAPLVDVPGTPPVRWGDFARVRPNPGRSGSTTVSLELQRPDRVLVRIQDIAGRTVHVLADWTFGAGQHELPWDGRDRQGRPLAAGMYFVRIDFGSGRFATTKKLVMVR